MKLLALPFLLAYAAFLRWSIRGDQNYLAECAEDGLIDSLSLREFRRQIGVDLVRLANVHARINAIRRGRGAVAANWE